MTATTMVTLRPIRLPEFLGERSGVATNALFVAALANRSMTREPVR